MNNTADEKILQAVTHIKESAHRAEAEFERKFSLIQQKASAPIDLFGGDVTRRVVDIRSEVRLASDDLYATLQNLVIMLDKQCRTYLEESPSVDVIHTVQKTIIWLNEESQISNTFTASLNAQNLGDVATMQYVPSMECKMIQKYWEETFRNMPEAKQILKDEEEAQKKAQEAKAAAHRNIANLKREFDNITTLSDPETNAPQSTETPQKEQFEGLLQEINANIRARKKALENARQEMHLDMKKFDEQIELLQQERMAAGFFAISRKKELKAKIEQLSEEKNQSLALHQVRRNRLEEMADLWKKRLVKAKEVQPMIEPKAGDILQLGIDPLSTDKTPLLWRVVQVSTSKIALISRDILGYGAFKSGACFSSHVSYVDWLKNFEQKAFSSSEKSMLHPSPINHRKGPVYAYVYTKVDMEKFLKNDFAAKPTQALLKHIEGDKKLSSFDKQDYARAVNTSYWLHSQNPISEWTVHRVRCSNNKWEINTIGNVTNDGYTLGIRPAILVDRVMLAKNAVTQVSLLANADDASE